MLQVEVTMEVVGAEGILTPNKSRVEIMNPQNNWLNAFHFSRLKGLYNMARSFDLKLLHQILPVNERLSQFIQNNQLECSLYCSQDLESPFHKIFHGERNFLAAKTLLTVTKHHTRESFPIWSWHLWPNVWASYNTGPLNWSQLHLAKSIKEQPCISSELSWIAWSPSSGGCSGGFSPCRICCNVQHTSMKYSIDRTF